MKHVYNPIDNESLMQMLSNKLDEASKIPNINSGGCALVAHAVHSFIMERKESHMPEPKILFLGGYELNDAYSCAHAIVEYDGMFIDTDGIDDLMEAKLYGCDPLELPEDEVYESIRDRDNWNWCFNREAYASDINNIFEVEHDYS